MCILKNRKYFSLAYHEYELYPQEKVTLLQLNSNFIYF